MISYFFLIPKDAFPENLQKGIERKPLFSWFNLPSLLPLVCKKIADIAFHIQCTGWLDKKKVAHDTLERVEERSNQVQEFDKTWH
jgi:hypothetical protein